MQGKKVIRDKIVKFQKYIFFTHSITRTYEKMHNSENRMKKFQKLRAQQAIQISKVYRPIKNLL